MARARFVVHGAVQGVNFRTTAVREALRLAITGRVWNRDDGSVELIADVREVERTELGGKPRYEGFNITWSAPRGD